MERGPGCLSVIFGFLLWIVFVVPLGLLPAFGLLAAIVIWFKHTVFGGHKGP